MMLNEALRTIRVFHDKNQSEMAEALSISKSYLSEIESGDRNVTLQLLEKYSDALNVPMSSLLFFAEEMEGLKHPSRAQVSVARKVASFLKLLAGKRELDEQEKDRALSD